MKLEKVIVLLSTFSICPGSDMIKQLYEHLPSHAAIKGKLISGVSQATRLFRCALE